MKKSVLSFSSKIVDSSENQIVIRPGFNCPEMTIPKSKFTSLGRCNPITGDSIRVQVFSESGTPKILIDKLEIGLFTKSEIEQFLDEEKIARDEIINESDLE